MRRRPMNLFFPLSVTASTIVTVLIAQKALAATTPFELVGSTILATLMVLAVAEHWFLVAPLHANALWSWGVKEVHVRRRRERQIDSLRVVAIEAALPRSRVKKFSARRRARTKGNYADGESNESDGLVLRPALPVGDRAVEDGEPLSGLRQSRTRRRALSPALWRPEGEEHAPREVTIWCSNDYLGHGRPPRRGRRGARRAGAPRRRRRRHAQHFRHPQPDRRARGGTRRSARQAGGARLHLGLDLQSRRHFDDRVAAAELPHSFRRAQSQFDDRGRSPLGLRKAGLASQ